MATEGHPYKTRADLLDIDRYFVGAALRGRPTLIRFLLQTLPNHWLLSVADKVNRFLFVKQPSQTSIDGCEGEAVF